MPKNVTLTPAEKAVLDRFYREGGLRNFAPPHIHYEDPTCPHHDCDHKMEWIDFQLELFGEPEKIYKPLVRSWWEGIGFAGRCPQCQQWVRFTTLGMTALTDDEAATLPHLPENWHTVAQFA